MTFILLIPHSTSWVSGTLWLYVKTLRYSGKRDYRLKHHLERFNTIPWSTSCCTFIDHLSKRVKQVSELRTRSDWVCVCVCVSVCVSVTGESNPIHRLLLWNEKLASSAGREQMHLSSPILIWKGLKGVLSPGSPASFHAWFTLICLIGHEDLEMAHLSLENVLIFLRHCYVAVFDSGFSLSIFLCFYFSLFFSLSLPLSVFPENRSRSCATFCLSAFRFKLTQQKRSVCVCDFTSSSVGLFAFQIGRERRQRTEEQPSASNHRDLVFKE